MDKPLASRLTPVWFGDLVGSPSFRITRLLFLRALALVYLAAFVSLGSQVHGLLGERGLLPAAQYLEALKQARPGDAFWLAPTLGWLGAGDQALSLFCWGGAATATLALLGLAQGPLFALCWVLYLSLVQLGQDFLSFQWDILLVEAGFLTLLLAPWRHLRPRWPRDEPPPPAAAVWLLRLLLFKLMFSSGLTKLTWNDPTWWDLSALTYHYWTQPLPTPLAWYADHLPRQIHVLSCAVMYVIELLLPFLIFAPRRPRRIALVGFLLLQALIAATGNYGFFNPLTVVLCLPLLDDDSLPHRLRERLSGPMGSRPPDAAASQTGALTFALATALLALLSVPPLVDAFHSSYFRRHPANPLVRLQGLAQPLFLSNGYGLFRSMTTTRPELDVQGSRDGESWRSYAFRYKPGDPARAPRFLAPHMPRLDWQMWFAALRAEAYAAQGPGFAELWLNRDDSWLRQLLLRLLQAEPKTLALLGDDPFAGKPPRFVRLVLWEYRFSESGPDWWVRESAGVVAGPLERSEVPSAP